MTGHAHVDVTDRIVGTVSPLIFGGLTEHFGTGLYGGVWDLSRQAVRADVQAAVRALGTTLLRYPGGCFADWYHWEDGVGPREQRPTYEQTYWTGFRFDEVVPAEIAHVFAQPDEVRRAYGPVETNAFGTDEFLQYCLDVDAEPMLVANFGDGTPEEAAAWVRYTNRSGRSPRPVTQWSVGNELYGPWEIGHCSPTEYGERFVQFAQAMREVDRDIELTAVGCAGRSGAYPDTWNAEVVEVAGDEIDALSVHWYFPGAWLGRDLRDDENDYLQVAAGSDTLGTTLDAVIEQVDGVLGPDRALPLSLDEWNLWAALDDLLATNRRQCDAVFFAGCYNRMLERADRVRTAAISHLVNCMAPIQTRGDRHFVATSYLVAMLYARTVRNHAAGVEVSCDRLEVPPFADPAASASEVSPILANTDESDPTTAAVDATATADATGTTVFLANRSFHEDVTVELTGLPPEVAGPFRFIAGAPFAVNDVDHPDAVGFRERPVDVDSSGTASLDVPAHTAGALVLPAR